MFTLLVRKQKQERQLLHGGWDSCQMLQRELQSAKNVRAPFHGTWKQLADLSSPLYHTSNLKFAYYP